MRKVAAITGDDVLEQVSRLNLVACEGGSPFSEHSEELVSPNADIGTDAVIPALELGTDVAITGRLGDPALGLGAPLVRSGVAVHELRDPGRGNRGGTSARLRQATHRQLLRPPRHQAGGEPCLSGFSVRRWRAGRRPGGTLTTRTSAERLLYEESDPSAYLRLDVTSDFTGVPFTQVVGLDRVSVEGAIGGIRWRASLWRRTSPARRHHASRRIVRSRRFCGSGRGTGCVGRHLARTSGAWCQMQLDLAPIWLGTYPMIATIRAVQRNEYTNITHRIAVAQPFEVAGSTSVEYYLRRMCVKCKLSMDKSDTSKRPH